MKKILVCIIVIVAIVFLGCFAFNKNPKEELENQNVVNTEVPEEPSNNDSETAEITINSADDLIALVNELYAENEELYPSLMTQEIDVSDTDSVSYMTGLENGKNLEYLVVSEPMMSSQAYSLVIAKVKEGVGADIIAREMSEKINTRKWICVSAEKLYATSSEDLVFLVMSSEKMAKPVYDAFKSKVGNFGREYEKTEVEEELPEEMY